MSDDWLALHRGQELTTLKRYDQAMSALRPALVNAETAGSAFCLMAQCQLALDDPKAAEQSARRALAAGARGEWPHRLVAISALHRGRLRQATEAAEEAVRQEPDVDAALHILTLTTLKGRHRKRAIPIAERNVELNPNSATAHFSLGLTYATLGKKTAAEQAYRAALRLDPQDAEAALGLAEILQRMRRKDEAAEVYLAAAAADPTDRRLRQGLSRLGLPLAGGAGIAVKLGGFYALRALIAGVHSLALVSVLWFVTLGILASATTALRIRGGRSLPAGVRAGLRADYRNAALTWGLVAAVGGVALSGIGLAIGEFRIALVVLVPAVVLLAAYRYLFIGVRPTTSALARATTWMGSLERRRPTRRPRRGR